MFGKREICLGKIHIVTSKDRGACGIEDLQAHASEGRLAVHAINVESGGAARDEGEGTDREFSETLKCSAFSKLHKVQD